MMTGSNDSLTAIADDLDQLADETAGNATRPSAEDISARARQAAKRVRAMDLRRMPTRLQQAGPATQPVVGAFAPPFAGQPITATHPRALATETPEERHAAALGEDFQAGGNANLAADEVVGDDVVADLPVEPDPLDGP